MRTKCCGKLLIIQNSQDTIDNGGRAASLETNLQYCPESQKENEIRQKS